MNASVKQPATTRVIRSAADAASAGLSWRFVQDGEEYGIFGEDGEVLPRHYDVDGEPDGWEWAACK